MSRALATCKPSIQQDIDTSKLTIHDMYLYIGTVLGWDVDEIYLVYDCHIGGSTKTLVASCTYQGVFTPLNTRINRQSRRAPEASGSCTASSHYRVGRNTIKNQRGVPRFTCSIQASDMSWKTNAAAAKPCRIKEVGKP